MQIEEIETQERNLIRHTDNTATVIAIKMGDFLRRTNLSKTDKRAILVLQDISRVLNDGKAIKKYFEELDGLIEDSDNSSELLALRGLLSQSIGMLNIQKNVFEYKSGIAYANTIYSQETKNLARNLFLSGATSGAGATAMYNISDPVTIVSKVLKYGGSAPCEYTSTDGILGSLWNTACSVTTRISSGLAETGTSIETTRTGSIILVGVVLFIVSFAFLHFFRPKVSDKGAKMFFRKPNRPKRSARKSRKPKRSARKRPSRSRKPKRSARKSRKPKRSARKRPSRSRKPKRRSSRSKPRRK